MVAINPRKQDGGDKGEKELSVFHWNWLMMVDTLKLTNSGQIRQVSVDFSEYFKIPLGVNLSILNECGKIDCF